MHRALLITLGLGGGLLACSATNGDEAIFISKNVAPGMNCTFTASPTEPYFPSGTMSVYSFGYTLYPQLVSKVTSRDDNVEQRTIQARGARIDIEVTDPTVPTLGSDLTHFETRFSAPIGPNGGITDTAFEGIPAGLPAAILAAKGGAGSPLYTTQVILHVVVFGDLDGSEVVSQDWQYPVTLSNKAYTNILGTCPLPVGTVVVDPSNFCSAYQDGYSDCCLSGTDVVCPAIVAVAP